jgi:hypothetical protein
MELPLEPNERDVLAAVLARSLGDLRAAIGSANEDDLREALQERPGRLRRLHKWLAVSGPVG